jgi:two-component system, response regulator RegA
LHPTLSLARTEQPDAAIVDLHLGIGVRSGFEVIGALRRVRPSLITVLVSADFPRGIEVRVPESSPDLTFSKFVRPDRIWDQVHNLLRRSDEPNALPARPPASLTEVMNQHVDRVLASCDGNVTLAAQQLGVSRATLYRRRRG